MKEPKTMRKLHRIREQLYEEQKLLSPKALVAAVRAEAVTARRKLGLKPSHSTRRTGVITAFDAMWSMTQDFLKQRGMPEDQMRLQKSIQRVRHLKPNIGQRV